MSGRWIPATIIAMGLWEMWGYGDVRFFVDETGTVRFREQRKP